MEAFRSIFNSTLAPITPGPSSSNTCGPVRVGLVSRYILGETPQKAVVEYDRDGAFHETLYGMKSDLGFINGLLGKDQNTPDFTSAYEAAERAGMDISFEQVDDLKMGGVETARIRMTSRAGESLAVTGESLGGGAFRIFLIDDCPVSISGASWELLAFMRPRGKAEANSVAESLAAELEGQGEAACTAGKGYSLVHLKAPRPFPDELVARLGRRGDVLRVRVIPPVHPVVYDRTRTAPFETASGMLAYCGEHGCSIARAAVDYEMAVTGWEEEKIRSYGEMLLDIMEESRKNGMRLQTGFEGVVAPSAAAVGRGMQSPALPSMGFLDNAVAGALGIMEHSNASGKIVCVPTGGSSGIVPGLLFSAAEQMGLGRGPLFEALMSSGMIGIFMMVDGNEFCGGAHGCQAEIGCGAAMAAAGLVHLMGGGAKQACDAASMALQSLMGLICDPVAGLVQVPCLARNMTGVAVAAVSAKAVCSGFDAFLPFDEAARAMVKTGEMLPNSFGPVCSGCCLAPAARRARERREQGARHGSAS